MSTHVTAPPAPPASPSPDLTPPRYRRPIAFRDIGIILLPIILFAVLSFTSDTFFTYENLRNILGGAVPVGLIAVAGTVVIIAGGFDLSAGSIFAASAVSAALISNASNAPIGILGGILVGCALGLINGLLTTVGHINHFVGTLGTMIAYAGLATVISGSGLILITDQSFGLLMTTPVLGLRLGSWIFIAVVALISVTLNFTIFGRHVYASGGNLAAARLSGVAVSKTLIIAYVVSGGAAALAGILAAGTSRSVAPESGGGLIFTALAAILIGGNGVAGRGAIWRTVVGVLTLSLISNGFNLMGVNPIYQEIVSGVIILVAVGLDAWTRRRR